MSRTLSRTTIIAAALVLTLAPAAVADDLAACKSSASDKAAIAACTRMISAGSFKGADLARVHYERGMKYRYNASHDAAIKDFTRAIDLDATWAWPYVARGHSYASKKEFKKAFADQEKAIKLEPSHVTYLGRALDLVEAGAYDLALKDIDESLKLNPKYLLAHVNRGEIHLKRRDFDKAADAFRNALEINPKDERAAGGLKRAQNRVSP